MSDDWADEGALVVPGAQELEVVALSEFEPSDYASESDALNAFHRAVSSLDEDEQSRALRHGWVPIGDRALIEAGMRCLPLLDSVDVEPGKSALARLESIAIRVRSQEPTRENSVALQEWESAMATAKSDAKRSTVLGCGMLLAFAAMAIAFVFL